MKQGRHRRLTSESMLSVGTRQEILSRASKMLCVFVGGDCGGHGQAFKKTYEGGGILGFQSFLDRFLLTENF